LLRASAYRTPSEASPRRRCGHASQFLCQRRSAYSGHYAFFLQVGNIPLENVGEPIVGFLNDAMLKSGLVKWAGAPVLQVRER